MSKRLETEFAGVNLKTRWRLHLEPVALAKK